MKKFYCIVLGLFLSMVLLTGCRGLADTHKHQYMENVVQPTCTEKGYAEQVCACGVGRKLYDIEALGHIYKNKLCTSCGKEQEISEGFEYQLSSDGTYYTIIGMGTCKDNYLYIPSMHENIPIKSIGTRALEGVIKSVVFEEDCVLTTLEDNSLTFAHGLEEIILPNSLLTIGALAFQSSINLKSIHIPSSVSEIGDRAFFNCSGLENITVSEGNVFFKSIDGILYSKDGARLVQYALAKSDTAFSIPNGVEYILSGAFSSCDSIETIVMPDTVQYVSGEAFRWCSNLRSIRLSQNIKILSSFAFDCCINLESINIPKDTYYIDDDTFRYCSSLKNIVVDGDNLNYKTINGSLYNKDGTTLVQYALGKEDEYFIIPNTVINVGNNAFYGCKTIKKVVMSDNVSSLGESAFCECSKLESVILSSNIKVIKDDTFSNCGALQNVTLPSSIAEIGHYAFAWCTALKSIRIPSNCVKIGDIAFTGCSDSLNVIFDSTNNWVVYKTKDYVTGIEIEGYLLQDGNQARKLLLEKYCDYIWIKK